ncbi:hypothetical protein GGR56DRAFT_644998 [Xylariaceae sp. FL0804]|nr:hypothetical protein GGR56DRAFT_644998 [Xylariaceae sp. FL0804]
MNQPGQGGPAPGQQQQQPPQQQGARLLRPETMRTIAYLSPDERAKYEEGLRTLWSKMESSGPDTPDHQAARAKIQDFSTRVVNKIRAVQMRQAGPQGQQGGAGASGQSPATAARPSMPANRPQDTGGAGGAASAAVAQGISRNILEHVSKLPWAAITVPNQHSSPEQSQKWLAELKQKYTHALRVMDDAKQRHTKIDAIVKERSEKGQPIPPDEMRRFQQEKVQAKAQYGEADNLVKSVRTQMARNSSNAGSVGQGQNNAHAARSQPMQPQNSGGAASMQAATASVNAAMDAAKSQQIAAANNRAANAGGQPQQLQPQTPATPATPSSNAPGPQAHAAPTQQQTQIKTEPGTAGLHHPPPVNTALAAASSANMPSAGTPTPHSARIQTPQSAQQPVAAQVRPLTHAAAVNRANSSTNITGHPGQPIGGPSAGVTTTPGSGGLMGSGPQPHSHAHPQPTSATSALTSKMPIPQKVPENSQKVPQAVSLGGGNVPGRPTLGAGTGTGGVMNQPVITKMAVPHFDTEGDHVLSKKKLDELVRQVCGGGSPGADGNYLTPDVEESVLNVADNFLDHVLHTACRLAKERGSKVLEIRDIQLVLERVYNIRIPGYTTDELRTVRKVQPSPSWIAKMSAIQAAKVTSSKDDK